MSMNRLVNVLLLGALYSLLCSCSILPNDYSDEEWSAMTEKEREEAIADNKQRQQDKEDLALEHSPSKSGKEFTDGREYFCTAHNRNSLMCRD